MENQENTDVFVIDSESLNALSKDILALFENKQYDIIQTLAILTMITDQLKSRLKDFGIDQEIFHT